VENEDFKVGRSAWEMKLAEKDNISSDLYRKKRGGKERGRAARRSIGFLRRKQVTGSVIN